MSEKSYRVHELAQLSGVSVRTLHYYDEAGFLTPQRRKNNYRVYGPDEVDRLQQIMLYRKSGMPLKQIKSILDDASFDAGAALRKHLEALREQQRQTAALISSVEKTLKTMEGNETMSDKEKFEGFKQELIDKNEATYGAEVREKYGDEEVNASNAKLAGMSEEQWQHVQELEQQLKDTLLNAMESGEGHSGAKAQEACDLHRQWLCNFWPKGKYSKQAHLGLAEMYVADERFKQHYDAIAPGATEFLRDALAVYCK